MSGPPIRDRLGALRSLPPFIAMVWRTSPALTLATAGLRLVRAVLPIATLFIGKLIIDEVVRRSRLPDPTGDPLRLGLLLGAELVLALLADALVGQWRCWTSHRPIGSAMKPAYT